MPTVWGDTSNLNAKYDQLPVAGLGAGSLSGNALGMRGGLGQFPWREKSENTVQLQKNINMLLDQAGYCPIGVDGKLGPGTCAAAKVTGEDLVPAECKEFGSPPKKKPCNGGQVLPGKAPPADQPPPLRKSKMGGDIWWIVGGVVVAAGAVGTALWMRKKKRG